MELPEEVKPKRNKHYGFPMYAYNNWDGKEDITVRFDFEKGHFDFQRRYINLTALPLIDFFNTPGPDTEGVIVGIAEWSDSAAVWIRRHMNVCQMTSFTGGFALSDAIRIWRLDKTTIQTIKDNLEKVAPGLLNNIYRMSTHESFGPSAGRIHQVVGSELRNHHWDEVFD